MELLSIYLAHCQRYEVTLIESDNPPPLASDDVMIQARCKQLFLDDVVTIASDSVFDRLGQPWSVVLVYVLVFLNAPF